MNLVSPVLQVRLTKQDSRLTYFIPDLLTTESIHDSKSKKSNVESNASEEKKSIEYYILPEPILRMWGYPLPRTESCLYDDNEVSDTPVKLNDNGHKNDSVDNSTDSSNIERNEDEVRVIGNLNSSKPTERDDGSCSIHSYCDSEGNINLSVGLAGSCVDAITDRVVGDGIVNTKAMNASQKRPLDSATPQTDRSPDIQRPTKFSKYEDKGNLMIANLPPQNILYLFSFIESPIYFSLSLLLTFIPYQYPFVLPILQRGC